MPKRLSPEQEEKLNSFEWLTEMYSVNHYSVAEISQQLAVHPSVVSNRIKKLGVEKPSQQQLREAVLKRKYGVTNSSQVVGSREKAIATMEDRYGGHIFSKTNREHFRDRQMVNIYGMVDINHLPEIKEKTRQTNLLKYGYIHKNTPSIDRHTLSNMNQTMSMTDIANSLGSSVSVVSRLFDVYEIEKNYFNYSVQEKNLTDYIADNWKGEIILHDRTVLRGLELDLLIPSKKLAFEYCGTFWHSEYNKPDKNYHFSKTARCAEVGIQLITIFSDEWLDRQSQIQSKIQYLLGNDPREVVYARHTTVEWISNDIAAALVNDHHIQKPSTNSFCSVGLIDRQGNVVATAMLKRHNQEILIDRYATSCRVIGGFSKLLKYIRHHFPTHCVSTFADLKWSSGNLYVQSGMTLRSILRPDYRYVDARTGKTYHKFAFRHRYIKNKFDNYDPNLTEVQNCHNNHFYRIWNCGMHKYSC